MRKKSLAARTSKKILRADKKFQKHKKSLKKALQLKNLMPKSVKRMGTAGKVAKSLHKHQDTYLTGLSALAQALGKMIK